MEENLEIKELSLIEKVKYFFINPEKVFEQYIKKPTIFVKLLLIAIFVSISGFAMSTQKELLISKMLETLKKTPNVTQEAMDMSKNIYEAVLSAPALICIGLVEVAASVFLMSLIYWLITRACKGENSYKDTVAVYTLAYMPRAIYSMLTGIYVLATKSTFLIDAQNNTSIASKLLTPDTLFWIWQIALLIIGLAKVGNISKKKSAIIVLSVTAVSVIVIIVRALM